MSQRKIVSESNFDKIYWEGVGAAMVTYPQMFRVYVTKHVSHFQGTNRQLSHDATLRKSKRSTIFAHAVDAKMNQPAI